MVCTFGDLTDVVWWRELDLPARPIVGWDGRITPSAPDGVRDSDVSLDAYEELAGKTVKQARARIVEMLHASGDLLAEPRLINHAVKYYEKGDRPLEIVTTRQWYVRNGGRDADLRAALLARGRELRWHPEYMRARYESWVEGLNGDWLISRQRFFGVPFPVWYPLDPEGRPDHDHPLVPAEDALPVDPQAEAPEGYTEDQRGKPGGFVADPDIMDTWATSSLTPQIACQWGEDPDLFARTYPMDLRPQAHEIIRTWLFSTVVRADAEFDGLPWSDVAISGWVLDPDRKKMSKSKGNVVTPMGLLEQYGSDAVRYWAASGRPGTDTAFDEGQMKVGRRLAIKVLNASKFALGVIGDGVDRASDAVVTDALDRSMLASLSGLVAEATSAFETYDYARALERTEQFFWGFCDDYVELVKQRAYRDIDDAGAASARAALATALEVLLKLFAPHLPFVTEEVWSWWRDGSVHRSQWPDPEAIAGRAGAGASPAEYDEASAVIGAVRKEKTLQQRSLGSTVLRATVHTTEARAEVFRAVELDVKAAGRIDVLEVERGDELRVELELPPDP
jgi:valyl-tRNA synthetase